MMNAAETAALFIRTTLHISVTYYAIDSLPTSLPLSFALNQQHFGHTSLPGFLGALQAGGICMLSDRLRICYCLAHTGDSIAVIGPYRTGKLKRYEAVEDIRRCGIPAGQLDTYIRHFNALALHDAEQVGSVARALLSAVCSTEAVAGEQRIDMLQGPHAEDWYGDETVALKSADFIEDTHSLESYYISQIVQGNHENAIAAYHQLFRRTGAETPFNQTDAVEGMAILRTVTRVATRQAGVSSAAINAITEHYKLKFREAANNDELGQYALQMIREVCSLVVQHRTRPFSHTIRQAIDYIHRHLDKPLSVREIASEIHFSPNRLSAKFHHEVGVTLTAYITQKRLDAAANLLSLTSFSVQTISSQVGIPDSNYFSKLFKAQYGKTPREYRRQA